MSKINMNCQNIDDILMDYVRGLVDRKTTLAIETHAATCLSCKEKIHALSQMTQVLMANAGQPVRPPSHHSRDILSIARQSAPNPQTNIINTLRKSKP